MQRSARVDPLPRRAGDRQLAEDRTQIESVQMDQLTLEDVLVPAQTDAPYAACVVEACEAVSFEFDSCPACAAGSLTPLAFVRPCLLGCAGLSAVARKYRGAPILLVSV